MKPSSAAIAAKIYEALRPGYGRRAETRLIAKSGPDRYPEKAEKIRRTIEQRQEIPSKVEKTVSSQPSGTGKAPTDSKRTEPKSLEELFPTIVIVKGKKEITRPRVIGNR